MNRSSAPKTHSKKQRQNQRSQKKSLKATQKRSVAQKVKKANSFVASKAARRITPQWNKAQSPFSGTMPKEFVDLQADIDGMWRETYSAPKEVKPIDFSFFQSKIKNKKAFEEIKAAYDKTSFPVVKSLYQSKEAADARVKAAEGEALFMADTANQFKHRIAELEFASTVIPFLSLQEEIALTPGLEQEFDRQLSNLHQLTDETIIKAIDIDVNKLTAQLDAGKLPEFPAEAVNKIAYTPIYFALLKQHAEYVDAVKEKYKVALPDAEDILRGSLKRQGALPTIEQVNQHLDEMELPFILTAVPKPVVADPFNM